MDEGLIKRVLPHSIEAEQSVIGAMFLDKEAIMVASEQLTGEDFYQNLHGILFDAMVELYNEGQPLDLVTVQNRLAAKEVPPEINTIDFIRDLVTAVPTSANIKYYVKIVQEKSLLRKMIKMSEELANTCYQGKDKIEDLLEKAEKNIFALIQNRGAEKHTPISQIMTTVIEQIDKASRSNSLVTGLATGFVDLDRKTSGLQPSDLILIAARPSMGKTAFVLNLAQQIAIRKPHTTAIFSLEMSKEQLVTRLLSMESMVDSQTLRNGRLSDHQWTSTVEGASIIAHSSLIIDDTPGISIGELRSKCRKFKLEYQLELIIIDYLQLMSGSGSRNGDSRQQEISEISRSLKGLARELQVPVIALSQLSRACETRPDHRPMLSDLRESGAIEQDADVVMFLYRDYYYNKDTENPNIAELIIAKQRNGPIGTVELVWLPDHTKFANKEMEYKET